MKKGYTTEDYQTMPLEELQKLNEEMYLNGEFPDTPRKLESDGNGNILLDPNDPLDVHSPFFRIRSSGDFVCVCFLWILRAKFMESEQVRHRRVF